jgi:hypothetical protein
MVSGVVNDDWNELRPFKAWEVMSCVTKPFQVACKSIDAPSAQLQGSKQSQKSMWAQTAQILGSDAKHQKRKPGLEAEPLIDAMSYFNQHSALCLCSASMQANKKAEKADKQRKDEEDAYWKAAGEGDRSKAQVWMAGQAKQVQAAVFHAAGGDSSVVLCWIHVHAGHA